MDIVTITCDRDLKIQKLQSHSIGRYVTTSCKHWIIINQSKLPLSYWENQLYPLYRKDQSVKILTLPLEITTAEHQGWVRQQVLKFKIAEFVSSDTYLILDSKNIFIKNIDLNDWPIPEGNGVKCNINHEDEKWLPWLNYVANSTGLEMPELFWTPETPFRFYTESARQLLSTIDVEKLFFSYSQTPQCEFMLYSLFKKTEPIGITKPCKPHWFHTGLPDSLEFEEYYKNPNLFLTSFHRGVLDSFDIKLKHIANIMKNNGLDYNIIADAFLNYIKIEEKQS
jgi:hypothetical protein